MRTIWLEPHNVRLKGYSASVKGTKSAIRIDIECLSPDALGYLLRQLDEIDREQKAEARANTARAKSEAKRNVRAIAPPLLQLPHFQEER